MWINGRCLKAGLTLMLAALSSMAIQAGSVTDGSWSGNHYVYLDLKLEVPASIVMDIKDSSGDFRFDGVGENFTVERDSSGDISANNVGGDFEVLRDGSGEISFARVTGDVSIPDKDRS